MLREVRLYGELGRRFGRIHRFDVGSPAEALRALRANYGRKFDAYLLSQRDAPFRVTVGADPLEADRLPYPVGRETIRIIPLVAGGGANTKAWVGIVVGAALIYFSGGIGAAFGGAFGFGAATVTAGLGAVGWGLVLGGASQLLIRPPKPQSTDRAENMPSYAFNGAVNTVSQGNPVPWGWGEMIVGSQVISSGLFAEDSA
jgi:predicted phage tail protein